MSVENKAHIAECERCGLMVRISGKIKREIVCDDCQKKARRKK
jgi:hypothetical protein